MDNQGWVRLHRQIEDNELWFLETFTKAQAWIDLFLNANHTDGSINIRGNILPIKRGQIGWSELTMMKRWRWSRDKVRRYLGMLETRQQIIQQKSPLTTVITILKYDEYQKNDTTDQTTERQQKDNRRYTNKNVKNVNNEKNDKNKERVRFTPPTLQEVTDYCNSRQNTIDPQAFIDFYQSRGWLMGKNSMKDWQAAVRTWEQRSTQRQQEKQGVFLDLDNLS